MRLEAHRQNLNIWSSSRELLNWVIKGCSGKPRFEAGYSTQQHHGGGRPMPMNTLPDFIRAIQGHSGSQTTRATRSTVDVTAENTRHLYHGSFFVKSASILRTGIIPGGGDPDKRGEAYYSIMDPVAPTKKFSNAYAGGSPSGTAFNKVLLEPYRFDQAEIIICIDIRIAIRAGCEFFQTPALAVLCKETAPPESILWIRNAHSGGMLYTKAVPPEPTVPKAKAKAAPARGNSGSDSEANESDPFEGDWGDSSADDEGSTPSMHTEEEEETDQGPSDDPYGEPLEGGNSAPQKHPKFDATITRVEHNRVGLWWLVLDTGRYYTSLSVRKAFRDSSMHVHPDKNPGQDAKRCTAALLKLNEAKKLAESFIRRRGPYNPPEENTNAQGSASAAASSAGGNPQPKAAAANDPLAGRTGVKEERSARPKPPPVKPEEQVIVGGNSSTGDVVCPNCLTEHPRGMVYCPNCGKISGTSNISQGNVGTQLALENTHTAQCLQLRICHRTDRGPQSTRGKERKEAIKKLKRAHTFDYDSLPDRYANDQQWRARMQQQGHTDDSIDALQKLALTKALEMPLPKR